MDAAGRPSVIVLKGKTDERMDEGVTAGVIRPGDLVVKGSAGTWTAFNTADASPTTFPGLAIATEDANVLVGKGIDDNYASGDRFSLFYPRKGDMLQMWLIDGANVAVGALLGTSTTGAVKAVGATPALAIAKAEEALNLVGGAAADGRINATVL